MKNLNNMTKEQLLKEIDQLKDKVVELEKSELKSRIWLENSPVCTKIVDLDFNLQYMSSSGVRELKIDDITEFYGKPYPLHFYPDSFKIPMTKNLKRAKETGETITQEAPIVDIKGNTLWYHSTIIPVNNDKGQLDYIMVASLETTARKLEEEALKEEKLRLLEAQKIALLGRWELNLISNELIWSDSIFEIFEIDKKKFDASYEAFLNAIHPDDREKVNTAYTESLKTKMPYEIEHRLQMHDGSIKRVIEKCRTEYDNNGNALKSIGIIQDITKLKKTEEDLLENEEKYKALYDNAPLPYQSLNEDGSFRDINPIWLSTLGYKRNEVIDNNFADFLHPNWKPHFEQNFPEFKKRGFINDVQFKIRHKDGNYLDISFEGSIGYNADGSFKQTYCVFKDITEEKKTEAKLLNSEQNHRDLVDNLMDGVAIIDENAKHIYVNPKFSEITGYSRDELLTMTGWDFTRPEDRIELQKKMKDRMADKHVVGNYERIIIRKDGTEVPVEMSITVTIWQGKKCPMAIIHDITERKQAEEELAKYRDNLETLVKERTNELEEKNQELDQALKVFVGREYKINELQEKIRLLEGS